MTSGLSAGQIFAGRYRVIRPIAAGGMGAVYEVVHLETERRRALKVMHAHILQSEELRERFQREAKVAAHIESDYIVDVFDAGFDEETRMPFLVMELLRGEELGKRLKRIGRFAPIEVVTYMHHAALALDKTHRANIVHRDLKPENLFLNEREDGAPRVKVLDFGIAKIVAESATAGATQSIGTPLYMAPEQFNPRSRLSPSVDLYALAMVAYTLLVGKPYWHDEARGGNIFALANVVGRGPIEPASARAAARGVLLSPAFDAWFARATAGNPEARHATATEMIAAMGQALGIAPPERTAMTSLEALGLSASASSISSASSVSSGPPIAARSAAPAPSADNAPTLFTPPAHGTGPGMSATKRVPAVERRGIIIGASIAVGMLAGVALFVGVRSVSAPTPGAQPTTSAPIVVVDLPEVMVEAPTTASPAETASASASPSASAPKPGDRPPTKPPSPPVTPPTGKKKYTRD